MFYSEKKPPQTQQKTKQKKTLTIFLYEMHIPTSNLDFFPYISCLGILSNFDEGISFMLFQRLNGNNLIFCFVYSSGCCFHVKYFTDIFACFLMCANFASVAKS